MPPGRSSSSPGAQALPRHPPAPEAADAIAAASALAAMCPYSYREQRPPHLFRPCVRPLPQFTRVPLGATGSHPLGRGSPGLAAQALALDSVASRTELQARLAALDVPIVTIPTGAFSLILLLVLLLLFSSSFSLQARLSTLDVPIVTVPTGAVSFTCSSLRSL